MDIACSGWRTGNKSDRDRAGPRTSPYSRHSEPIPLEDICASRCAARMLGCDPTDAELAPTVHVQSCANSQVAEPESTPRAVAFASQSWMTFGTHHSLVAVSAHSFGVCCSTTPRRKPRCAESEGHWTWPIDVLSSSEECPVRSIDRQPSERIN